MLRKTSPVLLIAFAAVWVLCQCAVGSGGYWRDSNEFILSAFFLDIAHPAGFPVFAQIANLFALIPFGPIAWRINSFCCLLSLINMALVSALLWRFLPIDKAATGLRAGVCLIPALILVFSESWQRQAFTPEVYNANSIFIFVLLLLYSYFRDNGDRRLLFLCAFVAGLGLGNHVAIAFVLLPAAIIILSQRALARAVLIPCLIFGLTGLAAYAYIPVRAAAALPLNTGEARTFERFLKHVSDARDRELRQVNAEGLDSSLVHFKGMKAALWLNRVAADAKSMMRELSPSLFVLGIAGLLFFACSKPRMGLLLIASAIGGWIFFLGWDPDPWVPTLTLISLGAAYACGWLVARPSSFTAQSGSVAVILAVVILVRVQTGAAPAWKDLRNYELPVNVGEQILAPLPARAVYVTEASWFLLSYLKHIEGYRSDVNLVYQPAVLFPEFFANQQFSNEKGLRFQTWNADTVSPEETAKLARFTTYISASAPLIFEPNMSINHFYRDVARCEAAGFTRLSVGKGSECSHSFWQTLDEQFGALARQSQAAWKGFRDDSSNYFEASITGRADLAQQLGAAAEAEAFLSSVCAATDPSVCKLTTLNNLASYELNQKKFAQAAVRLTDLIVRYPQSQAVRQNLGLALANLSAPEAETVLSRLPSSLRDELVKK